MLALMMHTCMQERRKAEMQLAAEAEAASKAKASLLRENVRKANQKVLLEAQRLKAEGKATREAASQALLATLRNQTPLGYLITPNNDVSAHSCFSPVTVVGQGGRERENTESERRRMGKSCELPQQRITADDVLLRQRIASPLLGLTDLAKVGLHQFWRHIHDAAHMIWQC